MTDLGIRIIQPWTFKDCRGRMISLSEYSFIAPDSGEKIFWHHDMVSVSNQNVLRGIHVSPNLWKLATCIYGRIFLVVVDCWNGTNFGKWRSWIIDDADPLMILVPPGFGLAHLILSKQAIFYYKWSGPYDGSEQKTYRYDDPRFGIEWPLLHEINCTTEMDAILQPILSERDKGCDEKNQDI